MYQKILKQDKVKIGVCKERKMEEKKERKKKEKNKNQQS